MPEIDSALYRQVLGHFPTGVTVIAGNAESGPVGLAVGAFFSVSLDPPLVGWCPNKTSSSWPSIKASGSFCVNILAEDQEDVCRVFATKEPDKFRHIGWDETAWGPKVKDAIAWIGCEIDTVHDAGDHEIVIGRVQEMKIEREEGPLVFFRGGYGKFDV